MKYLKAIYIAIRSFCHHYVACNLYSYKFKGLNAQVQPPAIIVGQQNISLGENVSIGPYSIIFSPITRVTIKSNSYSGPRLFISTGNHYLKKGFFSKLLTDEDKKKDGVKLNWDVVIEEDVWIGANVSILYKHVGRGSVIACGAVVKKDVPPYSIIGGVPAKVIKFRFTVEEVLEHEEKLYSPEKRLSRSFLENIFHEHNEKKIC